MFTYFLYYLIIINILTYFLYRFDKRKAQKGKWRTKETTLLLFSILGGALGGYLAMIHFHHKTRKWYFVVINIVMIVLYCYAAIILYQRG